MGPERALGNPLHRSDPPFCDGLGGLARQADDGRRRILGVRVGQGLVKGQLLPGGLLSHLAKDQGDSPPAFARTVAAGHQKTQVF